MNQDEKYLELAGLMAKENVEKGLGGPFGAIIVDKDGNVVAAQSNAVLVGNDPTAHAEVQVIRAASQSLGHFDLTGHTIYSSAEPCPMCMAAIYWARLGRLVYSNTRAQTAAIGFDDAHFYEELKKNPADREMPCEHVPHAAAEEAFRTWEEARELPRY